MPLHPIAQQMVDFVTASGEAPLHTLGVEQAREQMRRIVRMWGPGEPVAHVEDRAIPGEDGDIPIRIYRPHAPGPLPVLVYFHGGGWVMGDLDTDDLKCRHFANAVECVVINVNYRHAPEHKFPAAPNDAYAATLWAAQHAPSFGGDASRLAVAGTSVGANLAAVVCLMARARGTPAIQLQVLSVPATDHGFGTASYRDNAVGYDLTRDTMEWFWNHYLRDPSDAAQVYASPLRAPDFRGLPAAFIATAEFDPLRDEGEAYARALQAAGVQVSYKCYEGMLHTFQGQDALPDIAQQLRAALAAPREV